MSFLFLNLTIPHELVAAIQLVAATAIYFAIVLAAAALALTIAWESVVSRCDGQPEHVIDEDDRSLPRAA